jgi:hypothetical protein
MSNRAVSSCVERPVLRDDGRRLIPCEGGPSQSRLVHGEPPQEIADRGGLYVLDDADLDALRYVWIADAT